MTAAHKIQFEVPSKVVMTSDEYHAHPALGSTSVKNILRSPAHYKYESENKSEPTPAMVFGTACHTAILEPNHFLDSIAVKPKFEGTGARAKAEQWALENHGKSIISADQLADIYGMLKSISGHKTARSLLTGGAAEESYFDQCPDTGIVRKARPDFLRQGHIIVDVKTTTDAEPVAFAKQIANFMYHVSAAYYLDIVSNVLGQRFDQFIIIAVEKSPPYGVSVHLLDEGTIDAGRFLYKKALKTLKECRDSNQYPGYPDAILSTAIPPWAFPSES